MKPTPTPDQLRPWPFHGYAPGGYLCTCRICSVSFQGDKRAMVCLSCAVVEAKKELAADLSAAPEGWRKSLEKIAAMRWHEDADLDDICTIADRALSAALSVPASAVVGEPVAAYHVKVKGYGEELCFTEDGANSLVKRIRRTNGQHGVATITPLYATLPNEALEQSEQATFDIAARLLKERDALADRISQQDAELERWKARAEYAEANLAEARKAAFIEAAEIAETLGVYPELNVFAGGPEWYKHGKAIAKVIRAKAEETRT